MHSCHEPAGTPTTNALVGVARGQAPPCPTAMKCVPHLHPLPFPEPWFSWELPEGCCPLIPLWIQKSPSPRAPSVTAFAFPGTFACIATLPQALPCLLWGCLLTLLIPCSPLFPAFLTAPSQDLTLLLCLAPWNLPPTHHSSVFAWVWVRSAQGLPLVMCLCRETHSTLLPLIGWGPEDLDSVSVPAWQPV